MSQRRKGESDPERTQRLPALKKVVDKWFSDEKDGTEPPEVKSKKGWRKKQ